MEPPHQDICCLKIPLFSCLTKYGGVCTHLNSIYVSCFPLKVEIRYIDKFLSKLEPLSFNNKDNEILFYGNSSLYEYLASI